MGCSINEKALDRALRFIDYRPRSSGETRSRMRRWGYSADDIDQVVEHLQSVGLIDDVTFARVFMDEMVRKGFGCRRVSDELYKKRLAREVIEEVMSGYPIQDEVERARDAAALRMSRLTGDEPAARRIKIKRYLMRRGFTPEVSEEVCRSFIVDTQLGAEYN